VLKDVSASIWGGGARAARWKQPVSSPIESITRMGNALTTSATRSTRAARALKAGVPFESAALTVNRLCGSGIHVIVFGRVT
jgi:acetyl-CoA C-acetyltransferase